MVKEGKLYIIGHKEPCMVHIMDFATMEWSMETLK